jgi:hypothetical protein
MQNIQRFSWAELANVASKPGVYAWYYSPQITRFDLTKIIEEVQVLMSADKADDARLKIEQFLDIHLFRYFKEAPFLAKISGPLKPSYEGELEHNVLVSDSLVARLQERPERLHLIAEVIEFSAPYFASPIYIGFSDNLQVRIGQHRALIERFRRGTSGWHEGDSNRRDAGFANQVVKRGLPPERLFVVTCLVESAENIHTDVENILNRIYYPILGRN